MNYQLQKAHRRNLRVNQRRDAVLEDNKKSCLFREISNEVIFHLELKSSRSYDTFLTCCVII